MWQNSAHLPPFDEWGEADKRASWVRVRCMALGTLPYDMHTVRHFIHHRVYAEDYVTEGSLGGLYALFALVVRGPRSDLSLCRHLAQFPLLIADVPTARAVLDTCNLERAPPIIHKCLGTLRGMIGARVEMARLAIPEEDEHVAKRRAVLGKLAHLRSDYYHLTQDALGVGMQNIIGEWKLPGAP